MITLMKKTVNGFDVVWANNGSIYFPRGLHDGLPENMQGTNFTCKTPQEFENICKQFRANTH